MFVFVNFCIQFAFNSFCELLHSTECIQQSQEVQDAMTGAGMTIVEHKELTPHLTPYFKCMLDAVKDGKDTMLKQGVTQERLDAYEDDLSTRFERVKQGHFAWDMFCAKN